MSALNRIVIIPLVGLTLVAIFLTTDPGTQVVTSGELRAVVLVAASIFAGFLMTIWLGPLQRMSQRAERVVRGEPLGSAPSGSEEALAIFRALAHQERELARRDALLEQESAQAALLGERLEGYSRGELAQESLGLESQNEALVRSARALNGLGSLLDELNARAQKMASGDTGAREVEERVLATNRLADADSDEDRRAHGELAKNIITLNNQLRRLTIQARVVASDNLSSPLLNERLPGDLGESFAAMVDNLRGLAERAQAIAHGDLTHFSEGEGDLNTAFNIMVQELRGVVEQITQTAVRISTSAEEIIAVLKEQELSASHQASGVEETQRTMETLLSSAKMIAESAQTVFKSAERTQANNRIISDRASELKSHTERIGEILESIKEIADRSDLLALNASLEGLRAGEAGKGFTLVANEMRRLAENIKGSVGDIKELLSDIRESALSSVLAIEEGERLSDRTTESALKITLITQQQQSGTEQVTQSMEELSHLINQGLAGTRQVTMAAVELADLSEDMRKIVEAFQLSERAPALARRTSSSSSAKPARSAQASPQRFDPRATLTRRAAELTGMHRKLEAQAALKQRAEEDGRSPDRSGEFKLARPETERARITLQSARPEPSGAELQSTMRFVPDEQDHELLTMFTRQKQAGAPQRKDDSPTIDISALSDELGEDGKPASDDQIDNLFEELSNTSRGLDMSHSHADEDDDDLTHDKD